MPISGRTMAIQNIWTLWLYIDKYIIVSDNIIRDRHTWETIEEVTYGK